MLNELQWKGQWQPRFQVLSPTRRESLSLSRSVGTGEPWQRGWASGRS